MILRRLLLVLIINIIILGSLTLGSTLTQDLGSKTEDRKQIGAISAGKTSGDLDKDDLKVVRGEVKVNEVRVRRSLRSSSVVEENPNEEEDDDLDQFFENYMQRQDRESFDLDSAEDDIQESDERMEREEEEEGGGEEGEGRENRKRSPKEVENRKKKNSNSTSSGVDKEEETGYGNMNSSSIPSSLNKFVRRMHDPETAKEFFHEYAQLANFPRETINWDEPHLVHNCWVHAMLSGRFPYSPSCDAEGQFSTKQCFLQRCWCVHPDTGKPVITNHGERFYYKMAAVNLVCQRPTLPPRTTTPRSNVTYFSLNQTLPLEDNDLEPVTKKTKSRLNNTNAKKNNATALKTY